MINKLQDEIFFFHSIIDKYCIEMLAIEKFGFQLYPHGGAGERFVGSKYVAKHKSQTNYNLPQIFSLIA